MILPPSENDERCKKNARIATGFGGRQQSRPNDLARNLTTSSFSLPLFARARSDSAPGSLTRPVAGDYSLALHPLQAHPDDTSMKMPNPLRLWTRLLRHEPVRRPIHDDKRARLRFEEFESKVVPTGVWTQITEPPSATTGIGDMLLLTDGEVMAQGFGVSNAWYRLTAGNTGDYTEGTWTVAAPMSVGRERFAAQVLPDGRVVVMGGEHTSGPGALPFTDSTEAYNPVANSWSELTEFPGNSPDPDNVGGSPSPAELLPGRLRNPTGNFSSVIFGMVIPTCSTPKRHLEYGRKQPAREPPEAVKTVLFCSRAGTYWPIQLLVATPRWSVRSRPTNTSLPRACGRT